MGGKTDAQCQARIDYLDHATEVQLCVETIKTSYDLIDRATPTRRAVGMGTGNGHKSVDRIDINNLCTGQGYSPNTQFEWRHVVLR